jgi:MFS family permease
MAPAERIGEQRSGRIDRHVQRGLGNGSSSSLARPARVGCLSIWTSGYGSPAAAIGGYLLAVVAASVFAPAIGALAAELFPTGIRATVAGWMSVAGVLGAVGGLVLFGVLVTALNDFLVAAAVVALPVLAVSPLYARFPETLGMELEESTPD